MKRITFLFVAASLITAAIPTALAETTELLVGLASQDVTPPIGVPLAGYGSGKRRIIPWDFWAKYPYASYFKASEGVHDAIRNKVMVLKNGDRKLLFLSTDLVGATRDLVDDFQSRVIELGYSPESIFYSATHTHSGPGTLSKNWLWQTLTTDKFKRKIYENYMEGALLAVKAAEQALEPADLYAYSFQADGIQKNRRGKEGHFDPTANLLLAKSKSGAWLGGLVNLAVHGTALGMDNLHFSADVPGEIERHLETALGQPDPTRNVTMLFINGAEGDVSPKLGGFEGMAKLGAAFAQQAMGEIANARQIQPQWTIGTRTVKLNQPKLHFRACAPEQKWLSPFLGLSLDFWLPRQTQISVIQLGDMIMMTWPGEPTTDLGIALRESAVKAGATQAWVLGLTNDYLAYFTTPEEYTEGGYEACSALYGPNAGATITQGLVGLLPSQ